MEDSDGQEMSGDEYDDIQYSDDGDETRVDEEDEGDLPENHGKMVAFQAATRRVLERQLEKMHGEVKETGRLVVIGVQVSYILKHIIELI